MRRYRSDMNPQAEVTPAPRRYGDGPPTWNAKLKAWCAAGVNVEIVFPYPAAAKDFVRAILQGQFTVDEDRPVTVKGEDLLAAVQAELNAAAIQAEVDHSLGRDRGWRG